MKALAAGVLAAAAWSAPLLAQSRDRSLARIDEALARPLSIVGGLGPIEHPSPKTFGIFTLTPPTGRGEMVRVSVPIGELLSAAVKGAATAKRRRQEAAARRTVQAALDGFKARQPAPQR